MAGVATVEVAWAALNSDEEFTETFDDVAVQPYWHQLYGTIGTAGGRGKAAALYSGGNNQFNGTAFAVAAGCANGSVSVTIPTLGPSGRGLVFRWSNETSYFLVTKNAGGTAWEVRRYATGLGSVTVLTASGAAPAAGDTLEVRMLENSVTLWVNGTNRGSFLDTFNQAEGWCGLWMDGTMEAETFTSTLTWTDITQYVRSLDTSRGRETVLDRFEAGEVKGLVLDNSDRRFEPANASSPYYPNVLPGRHVRLRVDGTTLWRGHLDDWPTDWYEGGETDISLEASGVFETMAQATLKSPWEFENEHCLAVHPPVAWLRLGELDEADAVENTAGIGSAGNGTRPDLLKLVDSLVVSDADGATEWPLDDYRYPTFPPTTAPEGEFSTVEFVCRIPRLVEDTVAKIRYLFSSERIEVVHEARSKNGSGGSDEGCLQVYFWDDNNNLRIHYTSKKVDDNRPHHVLVSVNNTGVLGSYATAVYVDGVEVTASTSGALNTGFVSSKSVWRLGRAWTNNAGHPLDGIQLDEVKVYRSPLTADDVQRHYQAARLPWKDERTDARLRRLAFLTRWPDTRLVADAGLALMQAEKSMQDLVLLEYAQIVEATEGGQLYERADGRVRLASRYARHTDSVSSTVQATFGDAGTESEYTGVSFTYSRERVRNIYDGHRWDGTQVHRENTTSVKKLGRHPYEEPADLRLRTDREVADKGDYLVSSYGDVRFLVRELVLEPAGSTDPLWTLIKTLDINHRVRVRRRPGNDPLETPVEQDAWIEQVNHTLDADGAWITRYVLTPVEATLMVLDSATGTLDSARLGW